jgi:hypothetical protein
VRQDDLIRLTTLAFWNRHLPGSQEAGQDLIGTAGSSARATFRHDIGDEGNSPPREGTTP